MIIIIIITIIIIIAIIVVSISLVCNLFSRAYVGVPATTGTMFTFIFHTLFSFFDRSRYYQSSRVPYNLPLCYKVMQSQLFGIHFFPYQQWSSQASLQL